jgi:hypothetical protein
MKLGSNAIQFSIKRPKTVTAIMVLVTLILGSFISRVQNQIDTDPENMLSENEPVRVFHHLTKKEFTLHDVVVLGIVNENHPDGVFNPSTLKHVQELTDFAKNLEDPDDPEKRVVTRNFMAPSTVDNIEQAGLGQVRFEWLMKEVPTTREGALKIRDNAMANPLLKGTLVSEDGKALCLYIPITSKDFAYKVRDQLLDKIKLFDNSNGDQYHITGLPVAEDTFGVEMFIQMAVSAPLAMIAIFLLMLLFFKKVQLIIAPMIIAMVTVVCTMGTLIGTGFTVHIMSSMIPIFLMPIAVVDSIHILSEFFDEYQSIKDRRKTLEHVMGHLFVPMLYTSLTSSVGFASLAMTPIPPVRAFGMFVAAGIMLAWLLTIIFVPAYIMMMKEESLKNFGAVKNTATGGQQATFLSRFLRWLGGYTFSHAKLILGFTLLAVIIAGYGISKIQINDNPVKWFTKSHPIRVADHVLNKHFGGTYEAYLVLGAADQKSSPEDTLAEVKKTLQSRVNKTILNEVNVLVDAAAVESDSVESLLANLTRALENKMDAADDATYDLWGDAVDSLQSVRDRDQIFKQPEVLRYIETLQNHLQKTGAAGKSNSVTDVVKKVHQELFAADPAKFTVPDTADAVAQCLISFQNSHKPDDLWHLVTPDYKKANIWVQLKNGDNKDMEETINTVEQFMQENPPPVALTNQWAGLTYLNVVWQDKMVSGMRDSFLSSFVVVLIMMAFLFRSVLWGILAMIPLTVTVLIIYGIIGLIGKDYDMPVAVLSSLSLGLAVDFAIHFLERSRMTYKKAGSWKVAAKEMFEEPARAIARNVIVIAVGFTPLLAAPLVPYKTVGVFLATIMAISGICTMFVLPSLMTLLERFLFKKKAIN